MIRRNTEGHKGIVRFQQTHILRQAIRACRRHSCWSSQGKEGSSLCLSFEKVPFRTCGCPSRFARHDGIITKTPSCDLSHPLGSLLYTQSFGIADKAVADDDGFLCGGHRGGGHKAGEEQYGAEHLHGEFLSFEPASRYARRSLLAQAPQVQGVPGPDEPGGASLVVRC